MPIDNNELQDDFTLAPPRPMDEEYEVSFEDELIQRIKDDYTQAKKDMQEFHSKCADAYKWYHNANQFDSLRKDDKFPVPFFQEQVDMFKSYMLDKVFYKNQPCTLVGVEKSDKPDADAKQALFRWLDYKDKIYTKFDMAFQDMAMYRISVAQIDYLEEKQSRLMSVDVPEKDELGLPTGRVLNTVQPQVQVTYKGATQKRIDPLDLFVTAEKMEVNDEHPIMIRSRRTVRYYENHPELYHNVDRVRNLHTIGDAGRSGIEPGVNENTKKLARDLPTEPIKHSKQLEDIEWQGYVNKKKLYEHLGMETVDGFGMPLVDEYEDTLVIANMVEGSVIVRLEETPFDFKAPNIVIGVMQPDENNLMGVSLADKLGAIQMGMENIFGMTIENLKQSVNTMWAMKPQSIQNYGTAKTNRAGQVFECIEDVKNCVERLNPGNVSGDLLVFYERLKQFGQNASGQQDIISGTGEPAAETLGEANIAATQASLRMTGYLRTIEETFIEPTYQMRNQVNMQNLDTPYLIRVLGETGLEWRKITPQEIRANVDFICESASRETNRLVITQQLLQFTEAVPAAVQMGFPIRIDKILARLAEQGFSWSSEMVEEVLPTIKLEKTNQIDIDNMLLENMLLQFQAVKTQLVLQSLGLGGGLPGGGNGSAGGNGDSPQPTTESEASQSATARNQTNVTEQ